MPVLKELYDEKELKLINDFVTQARKTFKPREISKYAKYSIALERTVNKLVEH